MKQGHLETSLDVAKLMTQCGLGQTQPGTGACDAAFFDHSLDQLKVAQLEVHEAGEENSNIMRKYH
jgi:hypothetical protein